MRYLVFFIIFYLFYIGKPKAQQIFASDTVWVDSVYSTMTQREKIAQLFMIKVLSNGDKSYNKQILDLICDTKVGGVAFFQGGPVRQAIMTNLIQRDANIPLLVAIDGEWGLGMRLDSTISFPRQITLGALQDDSLIYKMGIEIAYECRRIGINLNFAPDVDINSNPRNPVINSRSFGESKYKVAKKGIAYMKGMQAGGLLACAKHFPGHGDTDTDSHLSLPIIKHTAETIDTLDLYPFREMIRNDVSAVMVAHLNVPALDTTKNSISSLSKTIVTGLLKNKLGFDGLVITDALEMKGVSKNHKNGSAEVEALLAGNDILLLPEDASLAIEKVKVAVDSSIISQELIDEKCKKVLSYKKQQGLDHFKPIEIKGISEDINSSKALFLQRELYEKAITLVKNNNNIIPLKRLDTLCLASVSIGDTSLSEFQNVLSNYAPFDHYNIGKEIIISAADSLLKLLRNYSYVIVGIQNTNNYANKDFGITAQTIAFIDSLKKQNNVILDVFASPYVLSRFENTYNIDGLIVSYQDSPLTESISAQLIFGGISAKGKLPVTASSEFPVNTGLITDDSLRLSYTMPEELGIDAHYLLKIDSIAEDGIEKKAFPGCVILAAKDGKVFYNKSFGYHTYSNKERTLTSDIFDMASITKIEASTMVLMKLYDEGKLDLDKHLEDYLPYLKHTNKAHIIIRDLLAHQARLKAWIPFYKSTIRNGKADTSIYHKVASTKYPFRVADSLYIRRDYPDSIMQQIINSPLNKKKEYLYSDMGFYFMMKIVEKISGLSFESFLQQNFYDPLGMGYTAFNPRLHFNMKSIVPTEIDSTWRRQLVHGDVNDQGAAMMGGTCGHAGLFSNAYNLATIMQMLLQNGEYAGTTYLKPATIVEFTRCQFPENKNRRALGFDKPALDAKDVSPCCDSASSLSYGHSGFTGTYFWVDPVYNIVYVFLSNRVYPDPNNKKLTEMSIRTKIQQVVYDAVIKSR
jgi:beta-N-acetylhexosaminidase